MKDQSNQQRVQRLVDRGVHVVDPGQTYVDGDVVVERISAGSVLYPGTRLCGAETWLGQGAMVGTEGPATLVNAVLDDDTTIASGYATECVLLKGASLGANAHVRSATLLEEQASTAHSVGLKHTLLLCFVTIGSLVNFCDCLMTGGTSRRDHSEVGSGYIHFNFTPWGQSGDKATASLIGDVPRGVFLRERRIFLGGMGGLVGPAMVGFGAIAGAGQVVRDRINEGHLVLQAPHSIDREMDAIRVRYSHPRVVRNIEYIANLYALRAWYEKVRLPRVQERRRVVMRAAIDVLDRCVKERVGRLAALVAQGGKTAPVFPESWDAPCPIEVCGEARDHVPWVKGLSEQQVEAGVLWLQSIVRGVAAFAKASMKRDAHEQAPVEGEDREASGRRQG